MADVGERRRPVEHGPAFDVSGDGLPTGETLRQRLGHPAGLQSDDPDPEDGQLTVPLLGGYPAR